MAGLREHHKSATRRLLEDTALQLFARDGFDATTVEAIAAEANVSPRTFFRYFATKDEVLNPDRRSRQARLRAVVESLGSNLSDATAARKALIATAEDFEADRASMRLHRDAAISSVVVRGRLFDVQASWQDTLCRSLAQRRGVPHDDLDAATASAAAMAVWQVGVTRWLDDPDDRSLRHWLERAFGS